MLTLKSFLTKNGCDKVVPSGEPLDDQKLKLGASENQFRRTQNKKTLTHLLIFFENQPPRENPGSAIKSNKTLKRGFGSFI